MDLLGKSAKNLINNKSEEVDYIYSKTLQYIDNECNYIALSWGVSYYFLARMEVEKSLHYLTILYKEKD